MDSSFEKWVFDSPSSASTDLEAGVHAIEDVARSARAMHDTRDVWDHVLLPASHVLTEPENVFVSRILAVCKMAEINLSGLLTGIIRSINDRQLFQAALLIRSLLEVTASIVYYEKRAVKPFREATEDSPVDTRAILNFMIDFTTTGRFDWDRFLTDKNAALALMCDYATDKKKAIPQTQQTNVMTMIASLEKRVSEKWPEMSGRTELQYALLSDFCHPSVGRMLLVVDDVIIGASPFGDVAIHKITSNASDKKVRWFLLGTTVPLVSFFGTIALDALKNAYVIAVALGRAATEREEQKWRGNGPV